MKSRRESGAGGPAPSVEPEYHDPWAAYSTSVEVFMALKNMDYRFDRKNPKFPVKCNGNMVGNRVLAYLKPPGSFQFVEKCQTETVYGNANPKFSTKLYFSFEDRDASAMQLKFEVYGTTSWKLGGGGDGLYGFVECSLDLLVNNGYKGLDLPILSSDSTVAHNQTRCHFDLGRIFLRAEVMKPIDYSVLIKFGLKMTATARCFKRRVHAYYFEMYKSNEDMYFQMENAYTLVHRSELIKHSGCESDCWNFFILPVSRVCNGDLGRVLKLEIYQADNAESPKGFAMTTLRKMLIERELVIPVDELSGNLSKKICLFAPLCYEVPLPSLRVYVSKGLIIRRIYAVDFAGSNWDVQLHKRVLHDIDAGRSLYEEAIIMASGAIIDIAQGESVFYSFGGRNLTPYVATFGQENHVRFLVGNYREALYGAKLSSESGAEDMIGECHTTMSIGGNRAGGTAGAAAGTSASSMGVFVRGGILSPLLQSIQDFLYLRTENFEYHVVFIFTDGHILDLEQCKPVIVNLAKLPVSLVFIGLGRGDFGPLLILENSEWTDPSSREGPCRKIVNVIHFRSLLDWDTALRSCNYRSSPPDVFRKEILTVIRDQVPDFMRVTRATI